jgi:hypothetical protein
MKAKTHGNTQALTVGTAGVVKALNLKEKEKGPVTIGSHP